MPPQGGGRICCQIPQYIAPYMPERGVVGEYIDRSMPSDSTANVLAKLFGSNKVCSGRKWSFDPSAECIVASKKAKKKATNQRIKPKNLNVVLLQQKEEKVPKRKKRFVIINTIEGRFF